MSKWEREEWETSWSSHLVGRWGWITSLYQSFMVNQYIRAFSWIPLVKSLLDHFFCDFRSYFWTIFWSRDLTSFSSIPSMGKVAIMMLIMCPQSWVNPLALAPSIWGFREFLSKPYLFRNPQNPWWILDLFGKIFWESLPTVDVILSSKFHQIWIRFA